MTSILQKSIDSLLEFDKNGIYQNHLNHLCGDYSNLAKWKTASKVENPDVDVLKSLEIIIKAASDADFIYKNYKIAAKGKGAKGFISKVILKTLKLAQTALAVLLIKNPLKIGIAYNAMHRVIKFLEREMIKKKIRK